MALFAETSKSILLATGRAMETRCAEQKAEKCLRAQPVNQKALSSSPMKTFTIDNDNNITAFPTPDHAEAAVGTGSQPFTLCVFMARSAQVVAVRALHTRYRRS